MSLAATIDRLVARESITGQQITDLLSQAAEGGLSPTERDLLISFVDANVSKMEGNGAERVRQLISSGSIVPEAVDGLQSGIQTAVQGLGEKLAELKSSGLTKQELSSVFSQMASRHGERSARQIFAEALGARVGDLTMDGVEWVQAEVGRMEGNILRYQSVLLTHLDGAKLLDANFNGKLDADDLIFTAGADGKIDTRNVGEALRDEIKIGAAIVNAVEKMVAADHDFETIRNHRYNKDLWEKGVGERMLPRKPGSFEPKVGVRPSDAIADIIANPDEYAFDCATAMVIVYYIAILDLIGPKDFDRICMDLAVGPWDYENHLRDALKYTYGDGEADQDHRDSLRAGHYTYIKNWEVSDGSRAAGWKGENVLYLGGGRYYGHPFGITTEEKIVSYLNNHREAGSTRSASMRALKGVLGREILKHDKNPDE